MPKSKSKRRKGQSPEASGQPSGPGSRSATIQWIVVAVVVVGAAVAWYAYQSGSDAAVDVVVPELSHSATVGQQAFEESCLACHGKNAAGSDQGPPLVHKLYHPGHHGDMAFRAAARNGVRAHHWRFGNMPAQRQVPDDKLTNIIRYVRELQKANGIY